MAFKLGNMAVVGTGARSGKAPTIYSFYNEDNDTVTTAGYFKNNRLRVRDQIMVIKSDGTAMANYNVKTVAAGVVTVQANA